MNRLGDLDTEMLQRNWILYDFIFSDKQSEIMKSGIILSKICIPQSQINDQKI